MIGLNNLPFGMTQEDLIAAAAGASAVMVLIAIWMAFVERDPLAAKARSLAERRSRLKAAAVTPRRRESLRGVGLMRQVVKRFNLLKSNQADRIAQKLARAGWRSQDATIAYLFAKAVMPGIAAAAAALLLFGMQILDQPRLHLLGLTAAAGVLGVFLPDLYVKNEADKRRDKMRKSLPDGLDLMVICAEAGLGLDAILHRVARELGRTHPELSDELALTGVELGFLPERRMALTNLAKRTDLPGLRGMVNTLLQTEKYGTPLSQSLRVLSAELRNERLMRAEEKAARLPAIMTVPMIVFILPPLFVVLIGPAILRIMDTLSAV